MIDYAAYAAGDFCELARGLDDFCRVVHSHLDAGQASSGEPILFVFLNGVVNSETLDESPPDAIFLDLELYADSPAELETLQNVLGQLADYGGPIGTGGRFVQDVEFSDQRDDYLPQASADQLPRLFVSLSVELRGYYDPGN